MEVPVFDRAFPANAGRLTVDVQAAAARDMMFSERVYVKSRTRSRAFVLPCVRTRARCYEIVVVAWNELERLNGPTCFNVFRECCD